MTTTTHSAEITDPVTGQTTTLTAATAAELEQLIDAHLAQQYPDPGDASTTGHPKESQP